MAARAAPQQNKLNVAKASLAAANGQARKPDGEPWRRVVPSPEPRRILELRPIQWLLEHDTVAIAPGGVGIPTVDEPGANRQLGGVHGHLSKGHIMRAITLVAGLAHELAR